MFIERSLHYPLDKTVDQVLSEAEKRGVARVHPDPKPKPKDFYFFVSESEPTPKMKESRHKNESLK